MKTYNKILLSTCTFGSLRMLIGAISVVYMLSNGLNLSGLAFVKILQMIILFTLNIPISKIIDKYDRKKIYLLSIICACINLFILYYASFVHQNYIFYLAEIFNAFALLFYGNLYNAYLLDEYFKTEKKKDFHNILGKYNKFLYFGIAIFAGFGALLYFYIKEYLFLLASLCLFLLFIYSLIFLPKQINKKVFKKVNSKRTKVALRKILKNPILILSLILISAFYQIFIQYWQVLASAITYIKAHSYLFGLIFIISLLAQSLAGKIVQNITKIKAVLYAIFFLFFSLALSIFALSKNNIFLFLLSIAFIFFCLRLLMIYFSANAHKNITHHIRARFDGYINTSTTGLSAIFLLILSFALNKQNLSLIPFAGLALACLVFSLLIFKKKYRKY